MVPSSGIPVNVRLRVFLPLGTSGFLGLAFILQAAAAGAFGEEADQRKELARIQERIETARKSREDLQSRRGELDRELADIERNYGRLARTAAELEAEARASGQRLAQLERRRGSLSAAAKDQQRALAGQSRSAYAAGREDWLKLLLNQEDPSRLTRVLAYYSYLNHARSQLLQEMEQALAAARQVEDELLAESERLKGTRQRLAEERALLNQARQERRKLLAGLDRQLQDKDAELHRLREDEQRLQELLTSLQLSGSEGHPSGSASATPPVSPDPETAAACPVAGRLVERFGSPKANGRWDGILIAAAEGTQVRAVAAGHIAYSDWLRGYGLLIIVDHGNGVMSLYAFNQSLFKAVGEPVAAGEVIATVGDSGGRAEPGLYFGIREQGRAVDPLPWCRRAN
jgi:septal ring factor EnvC (AmiA/AmiB activator)